ncbi:hypothetical protein LO762_05270 [Actinocorallia sp. API 0066]|uniref:hypothetical protein n=1 Tax=Actinocorallia sp. API 0066 TaxID=2896846 RepID=UPI001E2F4C8D|nr:hypothetical protein [Actinocorallia sp. API 0066]MCD0448607.1 hypothetical protein [Actinocorallia sp. API 0066]
MDPAGRFGQRLRDGVLRTSERLRDPRWREHDREALRDAGDGLNRALEPLGRPRDVPRPSTPEIDQALDGLRDLLAGNRPLLRAVLYSPDLAWARFRSARPDLMEAFAALCHLAEAAWRCVADTPSPDLATLRPPAARLRFLTLSEPFRHRADDGPWKPEDDLGEHGVYDAVFGENSWHEYTSRCRDARRAWLSFLNAYESHPVLARADPADLERELGLLAFRNGRPTTALTLSGTSLASPAAPNADDLAIYAEVTELHLLPRFRIRQATALTWLASPGSRILGLLPAVICALTATASIALAVTGHFVPAGWTALAFYGLLCLGTLARGPSFATPWLLRLPAAASLGLLLLSSLHPTWWDTPLRGVTAPCVLVAASVGYLLVEARNHGAAPLAAVARALTVTAVGSLHALLVALIGLALVVPAYMESPDAKTRVHHVLDSASAGHSWHLLFLAASVCLAAGVFSQILWDDRPITAPLAHIHRRTG